MTDIPCIKECNLDAFYMHADLNEYSKKKLPIKQSKYHWNKKVKYERYEILKFCQIV